MAYNASHGPPCFDAYHDWAPAGDASDPPTLNDVRDEPRVYPEIAIAKVTPWRSMPEIVDNRAPRTVGRGEIPYPIRELGLTRVYEGSIVTPDREELMETMSSMMAGFPQEDGEGTMTVTPWPSVAGEEPTVWAFTARVLMLTFDPEWILDGDAGTYEWKWVLTLRLSDARFYTEDVDDGIY